MIKQVICIPVLLFFVLSLHAQERRTSFSVFAGPNYSNISSVILKEPGFNKSEGPSFDFAYQLGAKVNYQINKHFVVSSGIRFLERRSRNDSNSLPNENEIKAYIKGFAALGEISYRPNNSKLSITAGGNFEAVLWSSSVFLPSYNNPAQSYSNGDYKSKINYLIWNGYIGVNYHITKKISISLNYERVISNYYKKYLDEDPFAFAPKGTVLERVPMSFQFNLNYKF